MKKTLPLCLLLAVISGCMTDTGGADFSIDSISSPAAYQVMGEQTPAPEDVSDMPIDEFAPPEQPEQTVQSKNLPELVGIPYGNLDDFEEKIITYTYDDYIVDLGLIYEYVYKQNPDNPFGPFGGYQLGELDEWQYCVFEAFRDAELVYFHDNPEYSLLEYSNNIIEYLETPDIYGAERNVFELHVSFPQILGHDDFSKAYNAFFEEKYRSVLEIEGLWRDESQRDEAFYNWAVCFRYKAQYAYTWEQFHTVITEHHTMECRQFCEPIADNFDTVSGKRLALSDLFIVGQSEYEQRLAHELRTPMMMTSIWPLTTAYMMDREIPLPQDEHFLITPNGLAFLYHIGEIDCMAAGPVLLLISYDAIEDILNPEYFSR